MPIDKASIAQRRQMRASAGDNRPRRVALVGGWTGGHAFPAMALADALIDTDRSRKPLLIGGKDPREAARAAARGLSFAALDARPMVGVGTIGKLTALATLARGVGQARALLRRHEIGLVIGFGSFVAPAAILAAHSLGYKSVIHEANIVPGRANRLLARIADAVFINWPEAAAHLPGPPAQTIGLPVRREFIALARRRRTPPDLAAGPLRLLVSGGSLGSAFLDHAVPDLAARLAAQAVSLTVHHQCRPDAQERVRLAYAQNDISAEIVSFIDDMAVAYAEADFAISGAGAGTLAELALAGLPALIVPLAAASDDHQTANARHFSKQTGCPWFPEGTWQADDVALRVATLLRDAEAWQAVSDALRRTAKPGAAGELAEACLALIDR